MSQLIPYNSNYQGRQVDIEMLQSIAKPVVMQQVSISSVTQSPKAVTGLEKLAQRYTVALLSYYGTVNFDPTFGTTLLQQILGGQVQNLAALQGLFASASSAAIAQMRIDDNNIDTFGTQPTDEQIVSATLLDQNIDYGTATVSLRVLLTTAAGDSIEFVVPTQIPR